ncbi:MAG: carboxylesterase family protein [Pseudomonadales bacterium]
MGQQRRHWWGLAWALILGLAPAAAAVRAEAPEVRVEQGALSGRTVDGVHVFKGIPYALPPVGARRWAPPEPAAPWPGLRHADAFAPSCEQRPYPQGSFFDRGLGITSEDCLYLNVWTTSLDAQARRPVMVWIHGGGLTRGSGATDWYDGSALARKGVVLVTINYRLGVFGYLAHPALSAESPHEVSGNYGTLDQIAALTWVRANVARFGGDPGNVTVFGESAGSWSVHQLTASPLAAGLLHKAIGQSGAHAYPMPMLDAEHRGMPAHEALGEALQTVADAGDLAALRALPAAAVLTAADAAGLEALARPVVDGWVFPDQIMRLYRDGAHNRVPLLLGSNADEGTNLTEGRQPESAEAFVAGVRARYGDQADALLRVYGADQDYLRAFLHSFRDQAFTWPMRAWARAARSHGQNIWLYYFTHEPPHSDSERFGAYHAAEIRYVFNNVDVGIKPRRADRALAETMSDYWVTFAAIGVPSAPDAPAWPAWDAERDPYLVFAAKPRVEQGPLADQMALFDQIAGPEG